jgi:phosphohistidine phosphatase
VKTLLLMRHAKSDWSADYGTDHDRPLNDRGERSARAIGEALSADGDVPDHIISSTALRARTTAELAADAGGWECELVLDSRLYGGGADTVLSVAASSGQGERLMLVGHQPTWSILVSVLTGERVEVRTATVAVIDFEVGDWSQITAGAGRVRRVYQARDYTD